MKKMFSSILFICALVSCLSAAQCTPQPLVQIPDDHISKWEFVKLCQHIHDPMTNKLAYPINKDGVWCDPSAVQAGDVIFLRNRYADDFFTHVAPQIMVPYAIISHGERYDNFKLEYAHYLEDPKLLAWFTTHVPAHVSHHKLHALPLGTLPRGKKGHTYYAQVLKELRSKPKNNLLFVHMSRNTNPMRKKLIHYYRKNPLFTVKEKRIDFEAFMGSMAEHAFTLSPPGHETDCYRTWEAILVGSIPIIEHSHLDFLYEDLPVLFIDDWYELTEEFLIEAHTRITRRTYNFQKLSMSYWKDVIHRTRDTALQQYQGT